MTKGTKKTNRRLKKTVRKTLGTLFLISAIVVAAIPTEGLRAEEDAVAQAAHSHVDTHTGAEYKVLQAPAILMEATISLHIFRMETTGQLLFWDITRIILCLIMH